jgi:hypothetical protein
MFTPMLCDNHQAGLRSGSRQSAQSASQSRVRRGLESAPTASGVRRATFTDSSVAEYRGKGHAMPAEFVPLLAIGFVARS